MKNKALLIIDVQKGMDGPFEVERNNPHAESNIVKLLEAWRKNNWSVIHVKHNSTDPDSPLRPGLPGNDIKDEVKPVSGEKLFEKTVNSAFIGTGLEKYLHGQKITSLVITGMTTDHCVSTTVRMAGNLGFDVIIVSDATATFDRISHDGTFYSAEEMHKINLASLNGEFCVVKSTEQILQDSEN